MAELLKNLYSKEYIYLLSTTIHKHYPSFKPITFTQAVFDDSWQDKELKQRMHHIASALHLSLPLHYSNAITILKATFSDMNYDFGLQNMIFQDFVEVYGLDEFEISMSALAHFTINSSSEFAIRAFILKYPQKTMQQMKLWAHSQNEQLRRLASEGCRPRLPWAVSLPLFKENPSEVIKILDILKDDGSKYVQKSVANNLNDISKDNPQKVIQITKEWKNGDKSREWILKHANRTLLKASNKEVLALFGFHSPDGITLKNCGHVQEIAMCQKLKFTFSLTSPKPLGKLRIEFSIDFLRKNNKYNTKVFKITEGVYNENNKQFTKTYSFEKISTRVYYKGLHQLSIIVNGVTLHQSEFFLK